MRALLFSMIVILASGCRGEVTPPDTEVARPGPRRLHALIFDPARQHVVLFGGRDANNHRGDTWTWNGQEWAEAATTGPSPRIEPVVAYDSRRQRIVLAGGIGPNFDALRDMWEWNGTAWSRVTSGDLPVLEHPALGYDSIRGRLVLLGGSSSPSLNETWEFDGQVWVRRTAAVPASPRQLPTAPMSFSPTRQTLQTLVANMSSGTAGNRPTELWEWSGTAWSIASSGGPPSSPPPHTAVVGSDLLVLNISPTSPQTMHRWNGQQWSLVSGTLPPARDFAALTYDAARQRLLLYGGQKAAGEALSDLWSWDGTRWTEVR